MWLKKLLLLNNSIKHSQPKVIYAGDHTSSNDMIEVAYTIEGNFHLTSQTFWVLLSPNSNFKTILQSILKIIIGDIETSAIRPLTTYKYPILQTSCLKHPILWVMMEGCRELQISN